MTDLRLIHGDGSRLTYMETLIAMCKNYGTFCGRWHSNEFWKRTLYETKTMTEEQAKMKVFEIEREANARLSEWRMYQ